MDASEEGRPYREICDVCHRKIVVYMSADGRIKYQCPRCGTITVKSYKTRYHYVKDVRRPRRADETRQQNIPVGGRERSS